MDLIKSLRELREHHQIAIKKRSPKLEDLLLLTARMLLNVLFLAHRDRSLMYLAKDPLEVLKNVKYTNHH